MFYEQLEKICKLNGISVSAATLKLGITKGSASNWKKGGSPNSDVVVQFAKLFNVTTDYFLMDDDYINHHNKFFLSELESELIKRYRSLSNEFKEKINNYLEIATCRKDTYLTPIGYEASSFVAESTFTYGYKSIPVRGYVAAGTPIEAINNPLEEIQINSSIDADYALIVSGNSMHPKILDGSYVLVKNAVELNNGDIGVFYYDNNVTCKKWFKNDKIIKLISINPAYTDYVFDISDTKNENLDFKIEGKVVSTDYKFN